MATVKPVKINLVIEGDVLDKMTTKKTPRKTSRKKAQPKPVQQAPKVDPIIQIRDPEKKGRAWWAWGIFALLFIAAVTQAERIREYVHTINPPKLVDDATTPAGEAIKETLPVPEVVEVKDLGNPAALAKILELKKFYLRAERADGKIELRTGGSLPWRFNNPGRVIHGDFTRSMGAIGSDGVTAVFPTYDAGRAAMKKYLFTDASEYRNQTLEQAFKNKYLPEIKKATGAVNGTKLKELTEDQQEKLMDVVQKQESWIEGKVTVFENEADWKERGW